MLVKQAHRFQLSQKQCTRRFRNHRFSVLTPGARVDNNLDTFNLLGPKGGRGGTGDARALVGRRQGFAPFYVKHHPAGSPKVPDVMVAR